MASKVTSISPTCHTNNIEPAMLPGAKLRPNRKARCRCGEANMKRNPTAAITVITLLAALTLPVSLAAQRTRYKLIDIGTLGGPNSGVNGTPPPMINNRGEVAGIADTLEPCPYLGGVKSPAFRWENGVLTNLGLLPGG